MKSNQKSGMFSNFILFLVLITSSWGLLWSLTSDGSIDFRYFTNQSNLLVFITVFLVFINRHDQKWFKYLSLITLVNISMTGLIYHIMLASPPLSFQSHLTHTLTPLFYVLFYFVDIKDVVKNRMFWVTLIYPLIYFLIFLITGPFTGFYPYWFMNVETYGFWEIMKFVGLLMTPSILLLSLILVLSKAAILNKNRG